jgi:hypothetical protein
MSLSKEQISICCNFWGNLIATKGRKGKTPITKGLISKFQRHLKKILEEGFVVMVSLQREPQFPLDKALLSSKIDNPFPTEWIETVLRDDGTVDLFIDGLFVKELSDDDLSG